jgi:hypothetical protein
MGTLETGAATIAMAGQPGSADRYLVKANGDSALVAVIDGLGHGTEAAVAADAARDCLEGCAGEPLVAAVLRCHERLRMTRGVVMSLASIDLRKGAMTWLGIGNVAGLLVRNGMNGGRRHESLLLRGGVVGCRLPPMHARTLQLDDRDTLVFATDGVRADFDQGLWLGDSPQRLADRIMAVHGMTRDDALVLVVRMLAEHHE